MLAGTDNSATKLAQSFLDQTGAAMLANDFGRFAQFFRLPHTLTTEEGVRVLETTDDLRSTFQSIQAFFAERRIDQSLRKVNFAAFDTAEVIRFSYDCEMFAGQRCVIGPYQNYSTLVRRDGVWQIEDSQYVVRDNAGHSEALLCGAGELHPPAEGRGPAYDVMQHALDRMTDAYLQNDFDAFCQSLQLPLFVQFSDRSEVFSDVQQLRQDFEDYQAEFVIHRITDIIRKVRKADMIGDRRLFGAYRTHILSGTQLVKPAYETSVTLEQGDDLVWRTTTLMHPLGHLTLHREKVAQ